VGRVSAEQTGTLVEEQARVVAVGPGLAWVVPARLLPLAGTSTSVWVETNRKSACGSCPSSAGCATPVLGGLAGPDTGRLQVADHLGLRVGEGVVIGIPDGVLLRAAALAYLFPPAALVLGAGAAGALGVGDLGSALAGVLGLALGLFATRLMTGGTVGRGSYRPVLVRRYPIPTGIATGIAIGVAPGAAVRPNIDFTLRQSTRGT
jgi:sigma-E factor negative regulatory protein RseC